MSHTASDLPPASTAQPIVPNSLIVRLWYSFAVTLLPVAAFTFVTAFEPEWQSGKFSDYVSLAIGPMVSWIFYPFLIYSAISLLMLLWGADSLAKNVWIRLGIYTGTLLSLQFALMALLTPDEPSVIPVLFAGAGIALPMIVKWVIDAVASRSQMAALILPVGIFTILFFVAFALLFGSWFDIPGGGVVAFGMFAVVGSAPFWCLIIGATISYRLIKSYEGRHTLQLVAGTLGWLVAFGVAWRFAVARTLAEYAMLPTSPPGCYIATAAAQGHRSVVQARPVATAQGLLWVNRQLQLFKAAELTLKATAPTLHALLRQMYDWAGPPLARQISRHPLLADAAYLTLKPLEIGARAILQSTLPNFDELSQRLYADQYERSAQPDRL